MNKKDVVARIQEYLGDELKTVEAAAKAALEAARHEESKPEDEYDTRAIEAGYLAGAQAKRAEDIRAQLHMYKFLPVRDYGKDDVACPGALVELEHKGRRSFYFVVPAGGGLVMSIDGNPIQVVTPMSPIGEALMGRKAGETFEVEARDSLREYKVISIR
ncbi:MAG: GreA/GreB family elongation factor [Deltaproteobacteria bacterium]|nr:GreA/GreB family elongation factor [Deltaproteobacteria bacterium]